MRLIQSEQIIFHLRISRKFSFRFVLSFKIKNTLPASISDFYRKDLGFEKTNN